MEAQPPSPEETRPTVPSHTKAALGDLALIEAQRGCVWEMWLLVPKFPIFLAHWSDPSERALGRCCHDLGYRMLVLTLPLSFL